MNSSLKTGFKLFNATWKSYCAAKLSQKTGMTIADITLYKDVLKGTANFYSQKLALYLKESSQVRKARRMLNQEAAQRQMELVAQRVETTPECHNKV